MRPLFKLTLIILSLIPLFFAVTGLIGGAASNNGGVAVSAGLDNQYRYLSGYYLSLFFGIWYVLGDIDKRGRFSLAALRGFIATFKSDRPRRRLWSAWR